jgi:hypothetical protein
MIEETVWFIAVNAVPRRDRTSATRAAVEADLARRL